MCKAKASQLEALSGHKATKEQHQLEANEVPMDEFLAAMASFKHDPTIVSDYNKQRKQKKKKIKQSNTY